MNIKARLEKINISLAVSEIIKDLEFDQETDSYNLEAFSAENILNPNCGLWRMPFPKPSIEQLEKAYEIASKRSTIFLKKEESLNYLASTDWYIIRELDTGIKCPEEIRKLRQAAREKIIK